MCPFCGVAELDAAILAKLPAAYYSSGGESRRSVIKFNGLTE
jgi:hypothetical protein